jgi:peptidoglycan hydrolase CwlO-like protein
MNYLAFIDADTGKFAAVAAGLAYFSFAFYRQYRVLLDESRKQSADSREKAYVALKDLYETEKQRSEAALSDLKAKYDRLVAEVSALHVETSNLRAENSELRKLNMQYQQDARRDADKIEALKHRIEALEAGSLKIANA